MHKFTAREIVTTLVHISYRVSLDDTEECDMERLISLSMMKLLSIRCHYMTMEDLAVLRGIETFLGRALDVQSQ